MDKRMNKELIFKNNKALTPVAKMLRRQMTKEEKHLWYDFLSKHPAKIYRQRTIGNYVADFYCAKAKLIIELDGSHHGKEEIELYDNVRTAFFEKLGIMVIRIPNYEINNNFKGVCRHLDGLIENRSMKTK